MHIQTHILSGWCVGNLVPGFTPRERLFCMLAASLADLDGLGILVGERWYHEFHHVLGHNLLFAAVLSAALAAFSTHRAAAFGVYFALAHLHLLLDYYGSGPGWPICYAWPFRLGHAHCWLNPSAWPFYSWQNISAAFALLGWTIAIAVYQRRTPLELLMPSLDRKLINWRRREPAEPAAAEIRG